jgi:acyl-CoA synthetase (AMP-forming)/AMP-acid ligase II
MTTIRSLIDASAVDHSDDVYLIAPEISQQLSYAQLQQKAKEVAARLDGLDIGKGEKVAFLMDNGLWTATLFLAIMYSGRVVVPLNAVSGDSQIEYVLDHSDARAVLVSETYRERLVPLIERIARPITAIPASEDAEPQWPTAAAAEPADIPVEPNDDALLIYTSGTTGRPKGVLHSHRSVIAGGRNTVEAHALSRQDRGLCVLPLYHINAEIVSAVAPLISGGSVVMPHRFSTARFWDLIEAHQCTWFSVVPTIIAYLLEDAEKQARDGKTFAGASRIRFGRSASSALPPATHRAFEERFGVPIVETMGLSETAAQILSNPLPPFQIKYGSPGVPYRNEAKVVDASGARLPAGERGEILIRGENVMKEYYKNPEATREALEPDGWLHTGDLGYQDEDGFFFITGRSKELIIKGGENIAPREIDDVLCGHDAVLEAAAFGVPDDKYGQEVMACVVPKDGTTCDVREIQELCIKHLGRFKSPRQIILVDELPRGPSGKVQRLKIAEMLEERAAERVPERTVGAG